MTGNKNVPSWILYELVFILFFFFLIWRVEYGQIVMSQNRYKGKFVDLQSSQAKPLVALRCPNFFFFALQSHPNRARISSAYNSIDPRSIKDQYSFVCFIVLPPFFDKKKENNDIIY